MEGGEKKKKMRIASTDLYLPLHLGFVVVILFSHLFHRFDGGDAPTPTSRYSRYTHANWLERRAACPTPPPPAGGAPLGARRCGNMP